MSRYKIVRYYPNGTSQTIRRGKTLEEAKDWCADYPDDEYDLDYEGEEHEYRTTDRPY